ncbi:hypothetical protein PQX77_012011 [Marasmius sp. AFHP31]|nr:hypothetical protein PQX77_012011 [Marasmius sp. AFHP31]
MPNDENPDLHGSYAWSNALRGLYYGPGCMESALPKVIKDTGASRALIVTGKSLKDKTDVVGRVEAVLRSLDAFGGIFHEIEQHSPIAGIQRGLQRFRENGCDLIVAVGGGSHIDASKAILYFNHKEHGVAILPQIAIPTTLSAAEYTYVAGYTNAEGQKVSAIDPGLVPAGIILDAELTLPTPERLWLSTGIRALDHAVESLYRSFIPPPVKYICQAAIADLFRYLPQSKANPRAIDVRQKLQLASWMSIWPIQSEKIGMSAFGLSHALGNKLGATYGIPHGMTSCLTLASVVRLQARIASQEDKEWLANTLIRLQKPPTGSLEGDVSLLGDLIEELVENLGLKASLLEFSVPREGLSEIASKAVEPDDSRMRESVLELLAALY